MSAQQPTALRLADALDGASNGPMDFKHKAAAELRRLDAEVERKSDAIQRLWKERDTLRAVNAQLLEALEEALRIEPVIAGSVVNAYPEHKLAVTRCLDKARAAIAAAKGEA